MPLVSVLRLIVKKPVLCLMEVDSKCTTINSKTAIELNLGLMDIGIISGHQHISLLGIRSTCVKVRYIVFKMRL